MEIHFDWHKQASSMSWTYLLAKIYHPDVVRGDGRVDLKQYEQQHFFPVKKVYRASWGAYKVTDFREPPWSAVGTLESNDIFSSHTSSDGIEYLVLTCTLSNITSQNSCIPTVARPLISSPTARAMHTVRRPKGATLSICSMEIWLALFCHRRSLPCRVTE